MGGVDRDPTVTRIMCRATQITNPFSDSTDGNSSCVLGNTEHHLDSGTISEAFPIPGWEDGVGGDALVNIRTLSHRGTESLDQGSSMCG